MGLRPPSTRGSRSGGGEMVDLVGERQEGAGEQAHLADTAQATGRPRARTVAQSHKLTLPPRESTVVRES
jgi:hypothetical protein